jgi:hypothetical protein
MIVIRNVETPQLEEIHNKAVHDKINKREHPVFLTENTLVRGFKL